MPLIGTRGAASSGGFGQFAKLGPPTGSQQYTTPGTYSWTCPAGVTSVTVVCVGGGGSGNGFQVGAGGGGGALSYSNSVTVTPGSSYTVVVGAGGLPAGANAGGDGGDSSFNSTTVLAKGGIGPVNTVTGGAGGSASLGSGFTKYSGGTGGNGTFGSFGNYGSGAGAAGFTANGGNAGQSTYAGGSGGGGIGLIYGTVTPTGGGEYNAPGTGGSGGNNGEAVFSSAGGGGLRGGGGGGNRGTPGAYGANGGVRISWPGSAEPTPTTIGQPFGGGYYAGKINQGGVIYYLVVADKIGGQTTAAWYSPRGVTGLSVINGPANSAYLAGLGSDAAIFCENLTLSGYTDWYLPAQNELEVMYFFLKPTTTANYSSSGSNANAVSPEPVSTTYGSSGLPSRTTAAAFQSGGSQAFASDTTPYWSSTDFDANNAYQQDFDTGRQFRSVQNASIYVRACRRILVV